MKYTDIMDQVSPWSDLCELASVQHGVFTRPQAAALGRSKKMIDRMLQRGILNELYPGVLCFAGAPSSWMTRLMAATLAGGGSHASHRAAACLHGLDGFAETQPVEVTVARGRFPAIDDVIVHRWTAPDERDYTAIHGIRVSGVATTLAQLGAVVPTDRVEQALDDALRRGHSFRWIKETAARLHRPGPTGTGVLLRLLADPARQTALPDSFFERTTARLLVDAGLPPPVLQHPVRLLDGRVARVDVAWPDVKWGIECHSRRYHFGPSRTAADHDRDHQLALVGWQVAYLTWHQVQDSGYVADLVRHMLAERTRMGPVGATGS